MFSFELFILCFASFGAGFIDSIVGGGGLIQLPAFLLVFPHHPVVGLLATNKLVSMTGTAVSVYRFSSHVSFIKSIIFPTIFCAFCCSALGAYSVTFFSNAFLRPFFMIALFLVFLLTIKKTQFGMVEQELNDSGAIWKSIGLGSLIGFYDGFFGPGTGSFLIFGFVGLLGMTFVQGSAYAKVINLSTNLAAILLFSLKTKFYFEYALPMMVFNITGAFLGVKVAILRGNEFVRTLLRGIVLLTILKLGYDVLRDYIL
jgi:uncharacterized membrane protein YfcA